MANTGNIYTLSETVVDSEGKKHKIFPCPILYIGEVSQYIASINPEFIFASFLVPSLESDGETIKRDETTGKIIYGEQEIEELLSVIEIATRFKETKEQIKQWLDIGVAQQIVEILVGMSQLKKKTAQLTK